MWTPVRAITADVLMVAGGGGGAGYMGSGGGAGGLLFYSNESLSGQKTIVVGNGGSGGDDTTGTVTSHGSKGNDTTFSGLLTAIGGGCGITFNRDTIEKNGGSGGGGNSGGSSSGTYLNGGTGTSGQGNAGGDSQVVTDYKGGGAGGGGAGSAGSDADVANKSGGDGGDGLNYSTTFGVTYGENGYFAGGGGGAGRYGTQSGYGPGTSGTGGIGGGGDGAPVNLPGLPGNKHTGGGGGGGALDEGNYITEGGDGGSGIVIIKITNATLTFNGFSTLSVGATHDTADESFGYTIERSSVSASGPWSVVASGVEAGTNTDVSITEAGFYRATVQGTVGGAPATTILTNEITYTPTSITDRVIKNKVSGDRHTLVVLEDGTVYAWGRGGDGYQNNAGGLGDGSSTSSSTPVQVVGVGGSGYLTGVDSVYTNTNSSYAIKDGNVYAWGRGGEGDMGNGTNTSSLTPVQVKGVGGTGFLSNIVKLAGGTYRINAISSSGDVYGWGRSVFGSGLSGSKNLPVQVRGVGGTGYLSGIVDMKAYYESGVMAVKSDGTAYAWGWNSTGYHGSSTSVNSSATYPVQILGVGGSGYMTNVIAIGGGGSNTFSVLLKDDGTVYASGYNQNGELGDGTNTNSSSFVQVSGLTDIVKITGSALCTFTLALKNDGTLYSWGKNTNGQLGDDTNTSRNTPVQVLGPDGVGFLTDVIDIDTGDSYSIAFTKDGSVYTWGGNEYGQLGNGTANNTNCLTPKKVLKGVWPGDGSYLLHGYNVENQTSVVTNATLTFDGVNKLTVTAVNETTVETFGYTIERATNTGGPWTVVDSGVAVGATKDVTISQTGFYRVIVQGTAGGVPLTVVLANEIV
jgi:alpha-tubulin suppressor-like RCC1 family protein